MNALTKELQKQASQSELGRKWVDDPLMEQDVWALTSLGYTAEECRIRGCQNICFERISLPWLRYLTKLTVMARVRERHSLNTVVTEVMCLSHLDAFLVERAYAQPAEITDALLKEFIAESNRGHRHATLVYATRLWAEEGWATLHFVPLRIRRETPKVGIIPEEVLHQIYEHLDLFPTPLERMFRLQLALGCRLCEMLTMPRHSLKQEGNQWFLLRWVAKRKHWRFQRVHPLVAELVQEQQRFLNAQFGTDSTFDKLFCKASTARKDGADVGGRFKAEPVYQPSYLTAPVIMYWLQAFSRTADLRDKYGNRFNLNSHMFRRTKASVMAYCEAEDEYIAAVLGHGSLDMLPHYRKRSLERLEKESRTKGYVDMYGRITTRQPRKRRYEKLTELLKINTPLGECHRPTMLGDCQYRYACLSCEHHRVTPDDDLKLRTDQLNLQQDLEQAQTRGQERRVTEIMRLLKLVSGRLDGLNELQALRGGTTDGKTT